MTITLNWMIPVRHMNYNKMPASVWIRCLQIIPYLERLGIKNVINDMSGVNDISIFVRWQDDEAYELAKQLKVKGSHIVFDICVNYFDEAEVPIFGKQVAKRHVEEALRMVSVADVVTTASDYIAGRAREFHPLVEYLPDSIDFEHFQLAKSPDDFYRPNLRAIWSGVASKALELEPLLPLLADYKIELVIISNTPPSLKINSWLWRRNFQYRYLPWSYASFPYNILEGEICISYRSMENPYNMGHSFFKIGVFMAQGVPCLAVPQPSYRELLRDQRGGYLCESLEDWDSMIAKTNENRELLSRWSSEAQQGMQKYSTLALTEQYVKLFEQVIAAF